MAVGDVFPKMLKAPTMLGTTTTTVFTVTTNYQWTVKQIIICNTDGVDRVVTLAYDGTAATDSNCFVYRLPIAGYDTVVLDTGLVFESGDTLQGLSDTASKVTVSVTGWERQVA
jgi:hypothetical protein